MAFNSVLPLLIFCLPLLATATATVSYILDPQETTVTTTTSITTAAAAVSPLPLNITTIIFAVISAGNFQTRATLLYENPSLLPRNFTVFLPSYNHKKYSSSFTKTTQEAQQLCSYFLLRYHIVPIHVPFSNFCRFSPDSRLATLFPDYTLLPTKNNSYSVFYSICIHESCITRPNIYLFDYDITGKNKNSISWSELFRKIRVFLMIFFTPIHQFPIIIEDDNETDDNETDYEAVIELERIEEERVEEEERQQKAIDDLEDEKRREKEEMLKQIEEEIEREREIRRERDEREKTEDEERDEELERQYEIDEIWYFQEFDD